VIKFLWGKIVSSRLGKVIDPWDKFKFTFLTPETFYRGLKEFLGVKNTRFKFSPRVDDVFSPRRLLTILPQED